MLPTINYTTYTLTVPSTKTQHQFTRMTGYEEELLLMAKESKDSNEVYEAIKQTVKRCSKDLPENILAVDIEYLFLKIRQNSVDPVASLNVYDKDDQKFYPITVDLSEVEVIFPDTTNTIEIDGSDPKSVFTLIYPSEKLYNFDMVEGQNSLNKLIGSCIDKISVGEQIFLGSMLEDSEKEDFIRNLPLKSRNQAVDFIINLPKLFHEVKYKTDAGEEKSVTLSSLMDFFSFR